MADYLPGRAYDCLRHPVALPVLITLRALTARSFHNNDEDKNVFYLIIYRQRNTENIYFLVELLT
ncbi:MAG: hypothetical protein FWH55_10600 [Oscillospiraceae bacterium]|nr:hypothetical protein [Oscillospiraceae bacterium]